MEKLIRESDAIKVVRHTVFESVDADTRQKLIESIPAVEPKQGEWIHSPNGIDRDFIWWKCSECGQVIYSETEEDRIEFHAYCGRCGAKMK